MARCFGRVSGSRGRRSGRLFGVWGHGELSLEVLLRVVLPVAREHRQALEAERDALAPGVRERLGAAGCLREELWAFDRLEYAGPRAPETSRLDCRRRPTRCYLARMSQPRSVLWNGLTLRR